MGDTAEDTEHRNHQGQAHKDLEQIGDKLREGGRRDHIRANNAEEFSNQSDH